MPPKADPTKPWYYVGEIKNPKKYWSVVFGVIIIVILAFASIYKFSEWVSDLFNLPLSFVMLPTLIICYIIVKVIRRSLRPSSA